MEILKPGAALLKTLGTMSDFTLAAKFKVTPAKIKKLREKLNIPSVANQVAKKS